MSETLQEVTNSERREHLQKGHRPENVWRAGDLPRPAYPWPEEEVYGGHFSLSSSSNHPQGGKEVGTQCLLPEDVTVVGGLECRRTMANHGPGLIAGNQINVLFNKALFGVKFPDRFVHIRLDGKQLLTPSILENIQEVRRRGPERWETEVLRHLRNRSRKVVADEKGAGIREVDIRPNNLSHWNILVKAELPQESVRAVESCPVTSLSKSREPPWKENSPGHKKLVAGTVPEKGLYSPPSR